MPIVPSDVHLPPPDTVPQDSRFRSPNGISSASISMALGERTQPLLQMNFISLKGAPPVLICAEGGSNIWHET